MSFVACLIFIFVLQFSHPAANFIEDFDFEATNEKFKKDEVWGHLGKNKVKADEGLELQDEDDDVDVPIVDTKVKLIFMYILFFLIHYFYVLSIFFVM